MFYDVSKYTFFYTYINILLNKYIQFIFQQITLKQDNGKVGLRGGDSFS